MRSKSAEIEVVIEGMTRSGHGICGRIEVPHTVEGDRVRIQRRGRRKGRVLEILTAGKERVAETCAHASECGGCRWQQMSYDDQLKRKQAWVQKLFDQTEDIVGCQNVWRHRGKMEFSFSQDLAGHRFLGLYSPFGRGRVVDIGDCHLVHTWFAKTLGQVRKWWIESGLDAYQARTGLGALRTLTLRESPRTGDRLVILTVNGDVPVHGLELDSLVLRRQYCQKGVPTKFSESVVSGKGYLRELLVIGEKQLQFRVSPSAFFQPNPAQAEVLYAECMRLARIGPEDRVLDLCCGTGTLSLAAALSAREVVGVELLPAAVDDARSNAALNGLHNVRFVVGNVGDMRVEFWDVALVDPPRAGLPQQAIKQLIACRVPRVIYVSCNPTTQASDAKQLSAGGYRVVHVQPMDQFPHTPHVENIIVLEWWGDVG